MPATDIEMAVHIWLRFSSVYQDSS